ncbi:MAG: MFS transporter [Anaerolineae bacterium]|nr:MFS transporter [Anaerolineae bacterium]
MNTKQREITGWAMYDWANSAFSATVVTVLLGPYLAGLISAQPGGVLVVGGFAIEAEAFYPFCVSISVVLQVFFLPILGTLADHTHLKKRLMMLFAYTGAVTTILLFFVQSGSILLGGLLFIIANLSFGAAIVFYNAFLPDIANPDQQDTVSSKGFAYGYVGGGLMLALNMAMLWMMTDKALAVRISLAAAGLWWLVFTWLYPQRRLVQRTMAVSLPEGANYLTYSFKTFLATLKTMARKYPLTLRYLIAYLIYNDGIQTVNTVATIFAVAELGVEPEMLVGVVLMVQFVAALGAVLFNRLAGRIGAKYTVIITLAGWAGLLVWAFAWMHTSSQIWLWAFVEALVLGSSQALSRSIFAKMIPANQESAYFSLYEISERGTSWIGPVVFGLAVQMTGSSRAALLPLIAFFIIGIAILLPTNLRQAIRDAGNEVPARV